MRTRCSEGGFGTVRVERFHRRGGHVLDASALLCLLFDEPGADRVERVLPERADQCGEPGRGAFHAGGPRTGRG